MARPNKTTRIGLFGGTFDPVHMAHINIALAAQQQLDLDEVWILIDATPRRKAAQADYTHRLAMMKLATRGYHGLISDRLPMQQAGRTHDYATARELQQTYPAYRFTLIVGIDAICHLDQWDNYPLLIELVDFAIAPRIGWEEDALKELKGRLGSYGGNFRYTILALDPSDISSTEVRNQLKAAGKTDDLPQYVNSYIQKWQLYQ